MNLQGGTKIGSRTVIIRDNITEKYFKREMEIGSRNWEIQETEGSRNRDSKYIRQHPQRDSTE